jgi:hypothetical protein
VGVPVAGQAEYPEAHAYRQLPVWQTKPAEQGVPQVPQLAGSVLRLMQKAPAVALQASGAAEGHAHLPALHACPAVQGVPHAPQSSGSVVRSVQKLAAPVPVGHAESPGAQARAHCPRPSQAWPAGHALPHAPQFWLSVSVWTQSPPQTMPPPGQVGWQIPPAHCWLGPHEVMQPPQCWLSRSVSVQICPDPLVQGVAGLTQEQAPLMQAEYAPQSRLQAPQCAGSLVRSIHAEPQAVVPPPQTSGVHWPPVQIMPAAHAFPQLPQWAWSVIRSTQVGAPASPAGHNDVAVAHTGGTQLPATPDPAVVEKRYPSAQAGSG